MTDRPILFSGPMVRALMEGRKTQTRRVFVPPPPFDFFDDISVELAAGVITPKYAPGDRLWVREAWRTLHTSDCLAPRHLAEDPSKVTFEADSHRRNPLWAFGKLRPGMFMPRWASRLTLHVTDLRVQRLQEISEADARAEGIEPREIRPVHDIDQPAETWWFGTENGRATAKSAFRDIWDSLNAERAPWASNPWVVAVTFRPVLGNIDRGDNHD